LLKNFGFASSIAKLEEKVVDMDYEMAQRMVIAQKNIIMQLIHPAINNLPFSIHFMFVF
jgi:hypothetical protein